MPYKFGEYVSTYVDPQSVKISETLRDRFVQNFQANDQLAMAVDQLQAASMFESDVQRKRELQTLTENELAKLAEQGNYENLGMAIAKHTKDYVKAKAPIEQNYKAVQSYLSEFNEGLKKGDYTPEQQKYLSDYMLKTGTGDRYKGFEIDPETGKATEGSMWKGATLYKDPKIMDKISKAAGMLHERRFGSVVERVAQGEGGMYATEKGGTLSKIDQADIDAAWAAVMAEPGTKAYFDQVADMQANSYQMNGQLPQIMQTQAEGYTSAINQLNTALSSARNGSERSQIKAQLDNYTQELKTIQEAAADPNLAYAYVKSKSVEQQLKPFKDLLDAKGGIYEQTSVDRVKYDQKALDDYNRRKDWELEHPEMIAMSEVTADAEGGRTIAEKMKTITDLNAMIADAEKTAGDQNLSETVRNEALQRAEKYRIQAQIQQQNIIDAGTQSFSIEKMKKQDPTLIGVLHAMYPTASAGELALKFQQTFDNPKDQDYIDFKNKFKEMGNGDLSRHFSEYYMETFGEDYGDQSLQGIEEKRFNKLKSRFSFINDTDVDYKLGHSVKTASKVYYNSMPGLTEEDRQMATTAADAYFKGWAIPEHVLVQNATKDGTQDLSGTDLAGYKTEKWGFREDYGTNGGWELQMVKPGQGDNPDEVKTVIMDATQVSTPTLDKYTNGPEAKFARLVTSLDSKQKGKETSYEVKGVQGGKYKAPVYRVTVRSEGGNDPLVRIDNLVTGENGTFRRLDDMAITGRIGNGAKVTGYAGLIGIDLP
jgi:uncharacterized coiled-coil protein SlyX